MCKGNPLGVNGKLLLQVSVSIAVLAQIQVACAEEASELNKPITLETLTVTASKRPQLLKDVDATVTVRTGEELQELGIKSVEQLDKLFPGLIIDRRGNQNYTNYSLRGITSGDFYNPALQVYVDGVPVDPAFYSQTLTNVDRVEVLKGPQGTLYGASTQGGVINVITSSVADSPSAYIEGSYSGLGWSTAVGVSGKLNQSGLSGSLDLKKTERTGQITDIATNTSDVDDSTSKYAKARLSYNPESSPFSLSMTYLHDETESNEELYLSEDNIDDLEFDSVAQFGINHFERTVDSFGATVNYDFENFTISSVSSLQDRKIEPRIIQGFDTPEEQRTVSQELRAVFDGNDKINGVAGIYYKDSEFTRGTPAIPSFIGASENKVDRETVAVFGELTYGLTEALDITGGLRWSHESAAINYTREAPFDLSLSDSKSFNDVSPKLALGWEISEDQRIYLNASKATKAGGFNNTIAFTEADSARDTEYDSESSVNFELGWRGRLANGKVEAGVAAYAIKTSDKQVYVGEIGSQYLRNIGDAESIGIELESSWLLTDALTLDFGLNVGKSKYTSAIDPITGADYSGNRLQHAPDTSARIGVEYAVPNLIASNDVTFNVTARHKGTTYFDDANNLKQAAYNLLDASVSVDLNNGKSLRIFGNNLTDERYRTYSYSQGETYSTVGDERNFGVEFRAEF